MANNIRKSQHNNLNPCTVHVILDACDNRISGMVHAWSWLVCEFIVTYTLATCRIVYTDNMQSSRVSVRTYSNQMYCCNGYIRVGPEGSCERKLIIHCYFWYDAYYCLQLVWCSFPIQSRFHPLRIFIHRVMYCSYSTVIKIIIYSTVTMAGLWHSDQSAWLVR